MVNMHKVHCENKFNRPVFLTADSGLRADIPAYGEFEGDLDDRQYHAYLALVNNGMLINLPVKVVKAKAKDDGSIRD